MFRVMALLGLALLQQAVAAEALVFCRGALLGEITSIPGPSQAGISHVTHLLRLRNAGAQAVGAVVSFIHPGSAGNLQRAALRLAPRGSATLRLGIEERVDIPGFGATAVPDVSGFVLVHCG